MRNIPQEPALDGLSTFELKCFAAGQQALAEGRPCVFVNGSDYVMVDSAGNQQVVDNQFALESMRENTATFLVFNANKARQEYIALSAAEA